MAAERVPSVALVGAQSQTEALALGLQVEAAVLSVDLLVHPVLQLYHQLVVPLPPQLIDALQAEPVFPVHVAKATLTQREIKRKVTGKATENCVPCVFMWLPWQFRNKRTVYLPKVSCCNGETNKKFLLMMFRSWFCSKLGNFKICKDAAARGTVFERSKPSMA